MFLFARLNEVFRGVPLFLRDVRGLTVEETRIYKLQPWQLNLLRTNRFGKGINILLLTLVEK